MEPANPPAGRAGKIRGSIKKGTETFSLRFLAILIIGGVSLVFPAHAIPIPSNLELTSLSDNSAIITWTTTNEASSTEILWGSGGLTNTTSLSGSTKYHYVELSGLYQNTTYQYRIKSGATIFPPPILYSPLSFTTLEKPTGEYLFSFAVLNDLRYADGKANSTNARGIPYQLCNEIINAEVGDINSYADPNGNSGVAFTVINGNLTESSGTYGDQVGDNTKLKGKLDLLTGASDFQSNIAYKYLPTAGYQDKKATYTTDWITDAFAPLTNNTSIEAVYGYNAASKEIDSVFNYQFEYNNYNFIFLDSVEKNGTGGSANLTFLNDKLSSSLKKTFVFMSFPGYNPLDADTKDYSISIPTSEVGGGIVSIDNDTAFRATLEAFTDISGNYIVAAVISGHLGDNYKRNIPDATKSISYVRQGPALQFPTGYSIYKVYSTGYIKTFYKTTGSSVEADGDNKPYYEYARDRISAEAASGITIPKEALTQFWLGSTSARNFTYQYAFIPGLSPKVLSTAPVSNETTVSLNSPILIAFNKRMSEQDLGEWVAIKDSDNTTLTVSSESFLDASRTFLKVTHADFTVDTTYEVTILSSKVKDEGLSSMEADYIFTFDTNNGTKDENPPTASIFPLSDNSSTDPFPIFTGIATDESRVITVKYNFDNSGNWVTAEAVDGKYTGSTEVFQIKPTAPLSAGVHQLWLKTSDGIGNTSAEGFSAYSFTIIVGDKPTTSSFKINESTIYPGDTIKSTPKIEVTITSNSSLESGRISLAANTSALSFVKVDKSYYATYEVTSALSDGTYGITIEAFDVSGYASTYEVYPLYVASAADTTIQGTTLNYPNPFDPGSDITTTISYTLSKASSISLYLFDLAGNTIAKKTYSSDQSGGKAGYNEVTWDGKSDAGNYVGNGIYIYLIIADGKVIQNGKGKITVLKQ